MERLAGAAGPPRPSVWLVDGYNVLCAGALGLRERERWWSQANRSQLLELVEHFQPLDAELWVVFDGDRSPEVPASRRAHVVFASSADEWLLDEARARSADADVQVVTADRSLAERARRRGARIVAPREFVRRCIG
jgi:predicted RNA-binding protein with PIN domain